MLAGSTEATCAWDAVMTLRTASNEAATMQSGEARRAASILHQTPGWRWRRELCLTERSQRQSGPTTKAWFHDRCNRVDSDACQRGNVATRVRDTVGAPARRSARDRRETLPGEAPSRRVRGTVWARAESTARVYGKGGACGWPRWGASGLHRQNVADLGTDLNEIHVDVDSVGESGQHCFKELGRQRSCIARRHAGSTARRCVGSTIWTSVEKLDRPIVRVLPVHNDGGCNGTKLD